MPYLFIVGVQKGAVEYVGRVADFVNDAVYLKNTVLTKCMLCLKWDYVWRILFYFLKLRKCERISRNLFLLMVILFSNSCRPLLATSNIVTDLLGGFNPRSPVDPQCSQYILLKGLPDVGNQFLNLWTCKNETNNRCIEINGTRVTTIFTY